MINHIKFLVGTGFGAGLLPRAPGTFASLCALVPVYLLLSNNLPLYVLLFFALAIGLTFWVESYFNSNYGKDPALLVTDEWAGQTLVFLCLVLTGYTGITVTILAAGFILFRIFDIWKPFGINRLQNLTGGFGVLADDLLAGFYAFICLKSLIFAWPEIA